MNNAPKTLSVTSPFEPKAKKAEAFLTLPLFLGN